MNLPTHIKEFFAKRKITEQVLKDFSIGWDGKRIVYPVFDENGEKIFCNYRRDPASEDGPRFMYDKGSKVSLFGVHKIKNEKNVVICEGQNDCLAMWSQGFPTVTSTGGALSFQKDWAKYFDGKDVTIIFDNDKAGAEGVIKVLEIIPWAKVGLVWDDEIKDISDLLTAKESLYLLKKTLNNAIPFNDIDAVKDYRLLSIGQFAPTFVHDLWLAKQNAPEKVAVPPRERDPKIKDKLTRAKAYPIENLIKFNHSGSARCLWHSETEASLHLYREQNKCWCFGGCGRGYDAIDVYKKLHNCSFIEAVEALQ
jgi:hypothetical protein